MNEARESESGTVTMLEDCEIGDRIQAKAEKLDEHAREIVAAVAQMYHDERKPADGEEARSKEELALEDWFKAEDAFCAALEDRIEQECNGGGRP